MKEIKVLVCLGTTCFVVGGGNINKLMEIIPEKYGENVKVEGSPCLGVCSIKMDATKAPYVKVNNEIVSEATVEKVLAEIDRQLAE